MSSSEATFAPGYDQVQAIVPISVRLRREWLYFAELSSADAVEWSQEYNQCYGHLDVTTKAMNLIHSGQFDAVSGLLDGFQRGLESMRDAPRSMQAVMARSFHGVNGYSFYRQQKPALAREAMVLAYDAVVVAVSEKPFLLMMAWHCLEFRLHLARIARSELLWTQVHEQLDSAGEIVLGRQPLCRLMSGEAVYGSSLCGFIAALGPLEPEAKKAAGIFLDSRERDRIFDKECRDILRIPGFCLDYQ